MALRSAWRLHLQIFGSAPSAARFAGRVEGMR